MPPRSRQAVPFCVWCAIVAEFCRRDLTTMGIFVLLTLSTYFRPSEASRFLRGDLVPPVTGVSNHWCVIGARSELGVRTKTGATDVSVALGTRWLDWADPLFGAPSRQGHAQRGCGISGTATF